MLQMSKHYEPEFKKKIVRLHLEEGRTLKGLAAEYGVSKASISIWVKQFREECQTNEEAKADYDKFPYGKPQADEVARGSGTESMAVRD